MADLTKAERDELLERARRLEAQLYPEDEENEPDDRAAVLIQEAYFQVLGEYADRLPRVVMSASPFTGEVLKRSFDPWGLDGPWWQMSREVEIHEPSAPPDFKLLLGALALRGRIPVEAKDAVIPGPEVPYVIPRLLELPGMIAVISKLDLATGDIAYPIAYFSNEEIPPRQLHQWWLEQDLWFEMAEEQSGWLIANDIWDFDLDRWVKSGKVRWVDPGEKNPVVHDGRSGVRCPYLDLEGDRLPQSISGGERDLLDLPDGTPINPYEEDEDEGEEYDFDEDDDEGDEE